MALDLGRVDAGAPRLQGRAHEVCSMGLDCSRQLVLPSSPALEARAVLHSCVRYPRRLAKREPTR